MYQRNRPRHRIQPTPSPGDGRRIGSGDPRVAAGSIFVGAAGITACAARITEVAFRAIQREGKEE